MSHCAYSPNGLYIISASHDNTLKVWNSQTGKCVHSLNLKSSGLCCSVSTDGKKIVAGIDDKYLLLLQGPSSMNMPILALCAQLQAQLTEEQQKVIPFYFILVEQSLKLHAYQDHLLLFNTK